MWIGTHDIGWSHDQIGSAMWIGKNVAGSIKDQFEVIFGL
jgi:hypothetical protein